MILYYFKFLSFSFFDNSARIDESTPPLQDKAIFLSPDKFKLKVSVMDADNSHLHHLIFYLFQ